MSYDFFAMENGDDKFINCDGKFLLTNCFYCSEFLTE